MEQKKFMTKSLAVQGIGNKDHMQDIMEEEAEKHIANLRKMSGQPISTKASQTKRWNETPINI